MCRTLITNATEVRHVVCALTLRPKTEAVTTWHVSDIHKSAELFSLFQRQRWGSRWTPRRTATLSTFGPFRGELMFCYTLTNTVRLQSAKPQMIKSENRRMQLFWHATPCRRFWDRRTPNMKPLAHDLSKLLTQRRGFTAVRTTNVRSAAKLSELDG